MKQTDIMQKNSQLLRVFSLGIATATIISATAKSTNALTTAFSYDSASTIFRNNTWIFGIDFQVNSDISVTKLGYFDDNGDGFLSSHPVGIFNSSGTLLTSTTVESSDTLEANNFRYANTSPVTLSAGNTYRVVGANLDDQYTFNLTNFSTPSEINYISDTYSQGSTLTYLTNPSSNSTFNIFGPNFQFETATASVPLEFSPTLGLLTTSGILCINLLKRKLATNLKDIEKN